MITKPIPFADAIRFLLDKEQLPADWDAAMWQEQEPNFQTRAFFSAKVESARFLDRSQGLIFDYMAKVRETIVQPDGTVVTAMKVGGREQFVKRMRDFMITEGMAKKEEFAGVNQKDVTDIRSLARLRLIFDTTTRQAYGFGQWKQGMTPAGLRAFPAARLIRDRGVKEPRPRHQSNLGEVLLKTDPRWAEFHNAREIGGFGVPWGPYGFNSGVTQEEVSRREAEKAGLSFDTSPSSMKDTSKFTDGTEASTKKMDPAVKQKLLDELRKGRKPRDQKEAAREAAANTRLIMLDRGLADAVARGDSSKAEKYRKAIEELPTTGLALRVVDDGDRIVLNEGIGERLSKINKRDGGENPDQDQAIAQKIFEMVDKKSAEPQTRTETQKGVNRARQLLADDLVLTVEERRIMESPLEILLIHGADGRLKNTKLGNARDVAIPENTPSDAILSHNHPSGRGPSDSDVKSALTNPGRTMRIVTKNEMGRAEIFSLKAIGQPEEVEILAVTGIYREESVRNGDTPMARRLALALIFENFGRIIEVATRIL